jgi:hypothetical protein
MVFRVLSCDNRGSSVRTGSRLLVVDWAAFPGRSGKVMYSSITTTKPTLGSSSLLSNGYQGLFPWGKIGRDVKLTTHLLLMLKLRMRGAIPPLLQYFIATCLIKQ